MLFFKNLEEETDDLTGGISSLSKNGSIKEEFPRIIVKNLLTAIRFGSYEAQQRFPRLLQIVSAYPELTLQVFVTATKNIPCWMFLNWISQMTALLDKPEAKAVYHIVECISKEYPQVTKP